MNTNKVPSYWWEFGSDNTIIVESDDNRFPIITTFKYFKNADAAISEAQSLINDLNAGRINPRKVG